MKTLLIIGIGIIIYLTSGVVITVLFSGSEGPKWSFIYKWPFILFGKEKG
jgi:hypothetical protein